MTLADARNPRGGSWAEDGTIISALSNTAGLWGVPGTGGAPQPLTSLNEGELTHRWPQVLPGNTAVLFTAHSGTLNSYENATIDVQSLPGGARKTVWRGGYHGRFIPTDGRRGIWSSSIAACSMGHDSTPTDWRWRARRCRSCRKLRATGIGGRAIRLLAHRDVRLQKRRRRAGLDHRVAGQRRDGLALVVQVRHVLQPSLFAGRPATRDRCRQRQGHGPLRSRFRAGHDVAAHLQRQDQCRPHLAPDGAHLVFRSRAAGTGTSGGFVPTVPEVRRPSWRGLARSATSARTHFHQTAAG